MSHYYNEFDSHAAQWLRNLMDADLIPRGEVDERSITDVTANDLVGFTSCHFFAGIGGWPLALRLAGWPDDRPVWTGSCPCQPFSAAGKRKGTADERHLWPEFYRLIRESCPATVFGEQVSSAIRFGWIDGVFADLEAAGYACGAVVLGAHSVLSPNIRQRLFWVANMPQQRWGETWSGCGRSTERTGDGGEHGRLANAKSCEQQRCGQTADSYCRNGEAGANGGTQACRSSYAGGLGNATIEGRSRETIGRIQSNEPAGSGYWSRYELIPCRDGKSRRIEPGLEPLVNGFSFKLADGRTREDCSRAKILKGIGNAIVPQVAAEFIAAFMEVESDAS